MANDSAISRILAEEAAYLEAFQQRMATLTSQIGDELQQGVQLSLKTIIDEEFSLFNRAIGDLFDGLRREADSLLPSGGNLASSLFHGVLAGVLGAVLSGGDLNPRTIANAAARGALGGLGTGNAGTARFSSSAAQKNADAARGLQESKRDL